MALTAVGTTVGFESSEWTNEESGKSGISHRLTVSTGDSTETISIPDDLLQKIPFEFRSRLSMFGAPVRIKVRTGAFGDGRGGAKLSLRALDIEFLTVQELAAAGYMAEVYTENGLTDHVPA